MHAYMMTAAAAHDAACEPANPLMLDAAAAACRSDMVDAVRRSGPVRREAAATAAIPPLEAALLARHATADRRPTRERVLDRVVDGLLADLRR
jgi:hypothetical protein